jgi:hypothetical protein
MYSVFDLRIPLGMFEGFIWAGHVRTVFEEGFEFHN